MTIHSLDGVLEAERLGFKRVVLSRELTIDEIKYICDNSNIEIEVFIHGALCICYSGQCLLSSMIGARSGNRGKCAQPCRLPYQLIKNSEIIDTGHLLSPKDLCSLELLPTLVNLGITCFKIEGRLKNPEYVSTVTRIYRKYIDLALSDKPYIIDEKDKKDLLQVFNRGGFSKGYLKSKPNQQFVCKDKPNNAGIFIGNVYNFNQNKGYITLKLQDNISIGDTVSLENEKGSYTVSELINNNQNIPLAKSGNIVKIGRIKGNISVGDKIFKMSSKDLCNLSNEYMNNEKIKTVINSKIIVQKNTPISMQIYTDYIDSDTIYNNIDFTLTSDLIPVDSINSPITTERIVEQINKLGGTPFEFGKIDVSLGENLYIPSISKLNQLRRDCISKLENILLERIHRKCIIDIDTKFESYKSGKSDKVSENLTLKTIRDTNVSNNGIIKSYKGLSILLNTLTINENYSKLKYVDKIYIPLKYLFIPEFSDVINTLTHISDCYIYMPPVLKDTIFRTVSKQLPYILSNYSIKGFVISNISQIYALRNYINNYELIGNYTMNIYNSYTIEELSRLGLSCVTLSPELDKNTLNSFNSNIKTEAIIYGNLPVMTTNYCLLSGSNFCLEKCKSNCGNSKYTYYLKDRMNMNFRILPDSFSKTTTILNSKKTSVNINEINVDFARLDFLDESIDEICEIINSFKNGSILEGKDFTNGNFNRIV